MSNPAIDDYLLGEVPMKKKVMLKMMFPVSIISLALTSFLSHAVIPPEGTLLAKQQDIVINNGTEVSSLDPHKVEGVPESNIILDFYRFDLTD